MPTSTAPTLLKAGELTALVLGHLKAHPTEDFTPSNIAKTLGRSAGAVRNACDKLTTIGDAHQTTSEPRRYQAGPATPAKVAAKKAATRKAPAAKKATARKSPAKRGTRTTRTTRTTSASAAMANARTARKAS